MMNVNWPLVIFIATVVAGIITLIDKLILSPRRKKNIIQYQRQMGDSVTKENIIKLGKPNAVVEFAVSTFPVLFLVFVLRSFLYEAYQIPSGSMIPTLKVGDFILVSKFDYGVRLPFLGTTIWKNNEPKRGEVMVFKEPAQPSVLFIKRVIGLPGDNIRYNSKQLFINGEKVKQEIIANNADGYTVFEETLNKKIHTIQKANGVQNYQAEGEWIIPHDMYFVMGDNRDRSSDSRFWGFVPEKNIVGKANYVWMHWPSWTTIPRFNEVRSIK